MNRMSMMLALLAAVLYVGAPAALAQHGRGGGMGGGPVGVGGNPGMGMPGGHGPAGGQPGASDSGRGAQGRNNDSTTNNSQRNIGKMPAPDQLDRHPKLSSRLAGLLPAGTNMQRAASGFKNLGQFVAAVHVSHNLGIPFDQLKAKTTGSGAESLGKAIHQLDPNADAKAEAKKAESQARQDFNDSANENDNDKS